MSVEGPGVIRNVQLLRAVAACAVLYSHAADRIFESDDWRFSIEWRAGVDLFFVISGFVMTVLAADKFGSSANARSFLLRRAIRIVPAYWFFTLLLAAIVSVYPDAMPSARVNGATVVTSLWFIPWQRIDGQVVPLLPLGWTLNYEAFFYLCFAGVLLARRGYLILPVAFATLVSFHWFVEPTNMWAAFYTNPIILEFLLGMGIGAAYLRSLKLEGWQSLALVLLAIACAALLRNEADRLLTFGLPAALLTAAAALQPRTRPESVLEKAGLKIGDASYVLYLSHLFVVHATWKAGGMAGAPQMVTFISAVALSIIFAVLFHRSVERPVIEKLKVRLGELRGRQNTATA